MDRTAFGTCLVVLGAAVLTFAAPAAMAQIADSGQALYDEIASYGPYIAGMGIIVCGVGMIASLQGALYAGVPMIIGGTVVSLSDDIMGLVGWG